MSIIKSANPKPKIKHLKLNPLAIAKFFWKKGVEMPPINQRLTYFTYLEALKEGYLLFEEEWKAWPNGPVIESTVDQMYDHRNDLKKLFKPVEEIDDELVTSWLEKVYKKYKNMEQYLIFEKAQNKPWKDARKPLKSEREIAKITLANLMKFAKNGHSRLAA